MASASPALHHHAAEIERPSDQPLAHRRRHLLARARAERAVGGKTVVGRGVREFHAVERDARMPGRARDGRRIAEENGRRNPFLHQPLRGGENARLVAFGKDDLGASLSRGFEQAGERIYVVCCDHTSKTFQRAGRRQLKHPVPAADLVARFRPARLCRGGKPPSRLIPAW